MTPLTSKSELEEILDYLKEDVPNCLYIYLDLAKYGLENPNIKAWVDRDGKTIETVVMKYHDGFQIYSRETCGNMDQILELIQAYQPERISGNEQIVRRLETVYADEYESSYGVIFYREKGHPCEMPARKQCTFAGLADIPEIVDLLLTEKEFGDYYTRTELIDQLEDRYHTKMGRSMVIRDDGKIVGHVATFAESEDIAIVSGSVIHKDYRNTDCFNILNNEFYDQLCRIEQKDTYFFATGKRLITFFKKCLDVCGTYGKLAKTN